MLYGSQGDIKKVSQTSPKSLKQMFRECQRILFGYFFGKFRMGAAAVGPRAAVGGGVKVPKV